MSDDMTTNEEPCRHRSLIQVFCKEPGCEHYKCLDCRSEQHRGPWL